MQYFKSVFLTLMFFSSPGFAAEAFDNGVPQSLVEQLTSGQISPGLPDNFPDMTVPDELKVLGSMVNDFSIVTVFTTALAADEASPLFVQQLLQADWIQLLAFNQEQPMNGFIQPDQVPSPFIPDQQYCHDQYGTMSLFFTEADNGPNLLRVNLGMQSLMQPGFSCEQQNAQRQMQSERMGGGMFGPMNSMYMPRLVMPETDEDTPVRRAPFFGIRGFSGSDDDVETEATYQGEMTAEELNVHFAEQLEEQGWMVDSQWAGGITAGGNWTSTPAPNQSFLGVLSIMERSDEVFELKFRLVTRNTGAPGAAIRGANIILQDTVR